MGVDDNKFYGYDALKGTGRGYDTDSNRTESSKHSREIGAEPLKQIEFVESDIGNRTESESNKHTREIGAEPLKQIEFVESDIGNRTESESNKHTREIGAEPLKQIELVEGNIVCVEHSTIPLGISLQFIVHAKGTVSK